MAYINAKFQAVNLRFESIDDKFRALDQRLLDQRLDDMREGGRAELRRVKGEFSFRHPANIYSARTDSPGSTALTFEANVPSAEPIAPAAESSTPWCSPCAASAPAPSLGTACGEISGFAAAGCCTGIRLARCGCVY